MPELPITSRDNLITFCFYEGEDRSTVKLVRYLCWTSGSVHGDDTLYVGVIEGSTRPSEHSLEQINQALAQVPAERVFPPLPFPWYHTRTRVTVADDWDEEPSSDLYLKRPWMNQFLPDARPGNHQVAVWFAHEVKQLERLALSPPHPNLLRYHGCRVRNGRVTGILLDRVPGQDLCAHLNSGGTIDREPFFATLASAIDHLHNIVGLVHNDINPSNVMVGPDGAPTFIDLGAAFPEGEEMVLNVPFECWGDDPLDMDPETYYVGLEHGLPVSRRSRDIAALNHLRTWIDNPVVETTGRRRRGELAHHFIEFGNRRMEEAAARRVAMENETAKEFEVAI